MDPFLGVFYHAVGGFAAGSFYIPFKKVRGWAWESYWLVGGMFIWVICPLIAAFLTIPDLLGVYRQATVQQLMVPFLLGLGWGVGNLTFGLSLRYLGMSLGMGLALGFCTLFGSVVPAVVDGKVGEFLGDTAGWISLGGLGMCLVGILFCAWAGASKEHELPDEVKKETVQEFNFSKGVWLAFLAGVMSACFSIGIGQGEPLKVLACEHGAKTVFANNAPMLLILVGGGVVNIIWCVALIIRNRNGTNFIDRKTPLSLNYFFCAAAGMIAYAEFFFFGMGESQMGRFSVLVSWPIHMAFIIAFSNMWGLILHEWKGTSTRTRLLLAVGLLIMVGSTSMSAYGSSLKKQEKDAKKQDVQASFNSDTHKHFHQCPT
jgi:L-rhamnose-H+ transport protein